MTIQCATCGYRFPQTLRGQKLADAVDEHERKVHASEVRNVVGIGRRR